MAGDRNYHGEERESEEIKRRKSRGSESTGGGERSADREIEIQERVAG